MHRLTFKCLYFLLDMLVDICQKTGVLLDSCYTAKAVKGMVTEMKENPKRFKGNRVLFIHTGNRYFYSLFYFVL